MHWHHSHGFLPRQPCLLLLRRLLFWESAEFSTAARCSQRSLSVLNWPFGAGPRAREALSAVTLHAQGHCIQPPATCQPQGCQGRWRGNCGQEKQPSPTPLLEKQPRACSRKHPGTHPQPGVIGCPEFALKPKKQAGPQPTGHMWSKWWGTGRGAGWGERLI